MEKGWGVEENWMGRSVQQGIMKELEALHHNCVFEETMQQGIAMQRFGRVAWRDISELDRMKESNLRELFEKMISVPFELNKKCGKDLLLQATGLFEIALYQAEEGFYRPHVDGAYPKPGDDNANNGRKVTI